MAISINSCLKPSSVSPPTPSLPSPPLSQRLTSKESITLRTRCTSVAVACVIISGFTDITADSNRHAIAADQLISVTATMAAAERKVVYKWSDQIRKCPPWRKNVLENVMPENLPRRSDRRRTDGYVAQQTAPPVTYDKSCYSL